MRFHLVAAVQKNLEWFDDIMITFLDGILSEILPTHVTVNVHGVGYQIHISVSSFKQLPKVGERLKILTYLFIREDSHILYGFLSSAERDLFRLLVQHVSGVGPKLALTILNGMRVDAFKAAVMRSDLATIACISGVGKKTAERVVLELKDKLSSAKELRLAHNNSSHTDEYASTNASDALFALISLGYKQTEAHQRLQQVLSQSPGLVSSTEELIRKALELVP